MAKGQQRSNKEKKKPKKQGPKTIAAAPNARAAWQPAKPADPKRK